MKGGTDDGCVLVFGAAFATVWHDYGWGSRACDGSRGHATLPRQLAGSAAGDGVRVVLH